MYSITYGTPRPAPKGKCERFTGSAVHRTLTLQISNDFGWKRYDSSILYIILIRANEMQQYAGIYLLRNHSTCFGCPSHLSSGVHKSVTAASGTGHSM